jgi:hypothetical protein
MAAARRTTPLVVFVLVTAVVTGGAYYAIRRGALTGGTQATSVAAPVLPTGPLQYAGANLTQAHYLAGDVKQTGAVARASVLVVGKTADAIAHVYAMVAKQETLDCQTHTISGELAGEYDSKGMLKNTEYLSGAIGRPIESSDFEAAVICNGKPGPAWRAAADWKAAQRATQTPPDDLGATANANPKDADAWAWLCHGEPWHWSEHSLKDCDHAVSLQPDAAAVRIDRGYINLATGHDSAAMGDFRAVFAKDPANAAALYGKSLAEAKAGDLAGSKRDREQALAMDPTIPDWAERTYRFQISDPYHGRGYVAP